mmetsp:Transcript_73706/g.129913  ORF Transcript_73706/g.129913 Transcript_73706/m.129913 type:complete len:226 (-) Transcript_73706:1451-2128(-)
MKCTCSIDRIRRYHMKSKSSALSPPVSLWKYVRNSAASIRPSRFTSAFVIWRLTQRVSPSPVPWYRCNTFVNSCESIHPDSSKSQCWNIRSARRVRRASSTSSVTMPMASARYLHTKLNSFPSTCAVRLVTKATNSSQSSCPSLLVSRPSMMAWVRQAASSSDHSKNVANTLTRSSSSMNLDPWTEGSVTSSHLLNTVVSMEYRRSFSSSPIAVPERVLPSIVVD